MLEQKLSLKLAQKLVMTPSLQQAIKLLQMTRLELEGVLNQEMVENPVLEESQTEEEEPSSATSEIDAKAAEGQEAETAETKDSETDALAEIDLDAYFGDYAESWEGSGAASVFEEREGPPLENTLTREDDLYDQLLWQLHMMSLDPLIREIAEAIIGNLDSDGFLVATLEEIQAMGIGKVETGNDEANGAPHVEESHGGAQAPKGSFADALDSFAAEDVNGDAPSIYASAMEEPKPEAGEVETSRELDAEAEEAEGDEARHDEGAEGETPAEVVGGYRREDVEKALEIVRSLDPPGIACADLQESLLRQMDAMGEPEDSVARFLVAERWDAFTHRKFEQIAKELEVPIKKLRPAVETIASLNTRPGRQFGNDRTHYVEPDVHVVKVGGEYVVQLNDNGLPKLRISRAYRKMLQAMRNEGSEAEAQQYIKEKMRSAVWLIKSLDQRQRTIYKVATSIVEQQKAFLDHGVDHLRPMVLRDVAEDIEMHESTVSRVVSNKYIHTPRGLLPMKFFFHSGIDREYGGDISSLTVKRKIKHYIQEEDRRKPLSDSELMRILNREGIHIARRTVAKYRDELGIPSSTDRKKIF